MNASRILRWTTAAAAAAAALWVGGPADAVRTSFWTDDNVRAFSAGARKDTVLSSRGVLRLARQAANLLADSDDILFVNALAEDRDGNVFAATGPKGVILKITPAGKAERWVTLPKHPMLFSLAFGPGGDLYAGSGGKQGEIVKLSADGRASVCFTHKDVKYVWAMAWDENEHLYAACGSPAQVFRITPDGAGQVVYSAPGEKNIISLAYDAKRGMLYAGSDTNGLITRIAVRDGAAAFVLYDAPEAEISALAVDESGRVLASTSDARTQRPQIGAGVAPGGLGPAPGSGGIGRPVGGDAGIESAGDPAAKPLQAGDAPGGGGFGSAERTTGGAAPSGPAPGTNAVYRISAEGHVETLLRAAGALLFAMTPSPEGLLLGTGNDGRLVLLDTATGEHQSLLRARSSQLTAVLRTKAGRVYLGASNNGGLGRLEPGCVKAGEYVSPALDAKITSKWGRISWEAETPAGTKVRVFTRTGNVAEPAENSWSPWAAVAADAAAGPVPSPTARFLQYKLVLESADGIHSPEVTRVRIAYVTDNQPPRLREIRTEPAPAAAGGAEGKSGLPAPLSVLNIRWSAEDPNNDALAYNVYFREVGDKNWIRLEAATRLTQYRWDTGTVGDGRYEVKVEALDTPDNPGAGKSSSLTTEPVTLDNSPPEATIDVQPAGDGAVEVTVRARDALSAVSAATYALDSGTEFTVLLPADGVFDSREETFKFKIGDLKPGEHRLAVRVWDACNNLGHAKRTIRIGK